MEYDLKHFAYIGDSVWELFIRKIVIQKTKNQKLMHELTTHFVCANYQANMANFLIEKLNEEELEIQRRARNLKISINKRSNPKIHSLATSFEAMIGYFYFKNPEKLSELNLEFEELVLQELKDKYNIKHG